MKNGLSQSIFIYGVGSVLNKFTFLFLIPLFTRTFNPVLIANSDIVLAIGNLLAMIGMLQLESAVARFYHLVNDKKKLIKTALTLVIVFSVIICIIMVIVNEILSYNISYSTNYRTITVLAAVNIVFLNIFSFFSILIRFEKKLYFFISVTLLQLLATVFFAFLAVNYFHLGIESIIGGLLIGNFIGFLCILFEYRHYFTFSIEKKTIIEVLKYSLPTMPGVIINWSNTYVNRYIMLYFLSKIAIGKFAIAVQISSVFTLLEMAFRMAWTPYFYEIYSVDIEKSKRITRKVFSVLTVLVFSILIIFILNSESIYKIIVGKDFWSAWVIVGILAQAVVVRLFTNIVAIGPDILNKTYVNSVIYAISFIFNICTLFFLLPIIDITGAAISMLLTNLLVLILFWYYSERKLKLELDFIKFGFASFSAVLFITINFFFQIHNFVRISLSLVILFTLVFYMMKNWRKTKSF